MANIDTPPTLTELVNDLSVYKEHDKLNYLLNQEPPSTWIKSHPFIKSKDNKGNKIPYRYLPIDKVEYLLRKIFKEYKIEVLREGQLFNAIYVTVRVHYKDIVTSEWRYHDGVGAQQIQTSKGSSPADLSNINNGAVSMALPSAESYAIKDACEKFGKLFGSDISREGTLQASMIKEIKPPIEQRQEIEEWLEFHKEKLNAKHLQDIENALSDNDDLSYSKILELLKSQYEK